MRQIVLDTETTGLDPTDGHRVIEIGCVEIIDRRLTGSTYHQYICPDRDSDREALAVHGITTEFLSDKPRMNEIVDEFLEYIRGAELIIHNADFDTGFLDHEFSMLDECPGCICDICDVTDTILMAKKMYPGQRINLDALCRRHDIDTSARNLHGALLDARLLADVYLAMTGGQVSLLGEDKTEMVTVEEKVRRVTYESKLRVINADNVELTRHNDVLDSMKDECESVLWVNG